MAAGCPAADGDTHTQRHTHTPAFSGSFFSLVFFPSHHNDDDDDDDAERQDTRRWRRRRQSAQPPADADAAATPFVWFYPFCGFGGVSRFLPDDRSESSTAADQQWKGLVSLCLGAAAAAAAAAGGGWLGSHNRVAAALAHGTVCDTMQIRVGRWCGGAVPPQLRTVVTGSLWRAPTTLTTPMSTPMLAFGAGRGRTAHGNLSTGRTRNARRLVLCLLPASQRRR